MGYMALKPFFLPGTHLSEWGSRAQGTLCSTLQRGGQLDSLNQMKFISSGLHTLILALKVN